MRPLSEILLLALFLACSGSAPSPRLAPTLGRPPVKLGSTGYYCPEGFEFAAYGRLFYPKLHPSHPALTVRPDRCFAREEEALDAGYRLAEPPRGATVVAGLYLVPPEGSLQGHCRRAAEHLGFTVACPSLVPGPEGSIHVSDLGGEESLILEAGFRAPPDYVGVGGEPHGHLWVISTRPSHAGDSQSCFDPHPGGRTRIRGRPGRWVTCSEGAEINGGHIVLVWVESGVSHAVSLHGHTRTNRRLALALAERLVLIAPSG